MLDEETFFKCKWIIAKNELANKDKRGPQRYQSPLSDSILDIHARVTGVHKGLIAAKTPASLDWIKVQQLDLLKIDQWQVDIDITKMPDFGIPWNEFEALPLADTINSVYEFLYTHKDKRPIIFEGEYWYHETIVKNKINSIDQIKPKDVLVISFPFFNDFTARSDMDDILEKCSSLCVPVLLDCIWLPLINKIPKLKNTDAIEVITQSVTKTLPLSGTKGGILFKKKPLTHAEVTYGTGNKLGSWLFNKYMNDKGYFYIRDSHRDLQNKWCNILAIKPHDMVYVGICDNKSFLKKYSMGQGNGNLISLVPFFENDKMLSLFLKDNSV